jgi:hypothetical protein
VSGTKNGEGSKDDRNDKKFLEEYFPLCQYAYLKYPSKNYFVCLCQGENETKGKVDAEICDSGGKRIESVQITNTFDYVESLREEKLRKDGFSLGVGECCREKKSKKITQEGALRTREGALKEVIEKIVDRIKSKISKPGCKDVDVLLVASDCRL